MRALRMLVYHSLGLGMWLMAGLMVGAVLGQAVVVLLDTFGG